MRMHSSHRGYMGRPFINGSGTALSADAVVGRGPTFPKACSMLHLLRMSIRSAEIGSTRTNLRTRSMLQENSTVAVSSTVIVMVRMRLKNMSHVQCFFLRDPTPGLEEQVRIKNNTTAFNGEVMAADATVSLGIDCSQSRGRDMVRDKQLGHDLTFGVTQLTSHHARFVTHVYTNDADE